MAYTRPNNMIFDDNIESVVTMGPYINLLAAVFEQARDDWEKGWSKVGKIGEYYDDSMYQADRKRLKNLNKTDTEYLCIIKKVNIYETANRNKNISGVQTFLKSDWFELICVCCNLDSDAIRDEFERIKYSFLK